MKLKLKAMMAVGVLVAFIIGIVTIISILDARANDSNFPHQKQL
jgi:CHASE3 domain sensor protein